MSLQICNSKALLAIAIKTHAKYYIRTAAMFILYHYHKKAECPREVYDLK
jgi:hypothetical protein